MQRGRGQAEQGVRGDQMVPVARMPVDAGPVRDEDGRLGGRVRALRDSHRLPVVLRLGRTRPGGEDRRADGHAETAADRPVREAQVGRVRPTVRDGQTGKRSGGPRRRAAHGVPAVPARLRRTERHDCVRPGKKVLGRPVVAKSVLLRDAGHSIRTHLEKFQNFALRNTEL